RRAELAPFGEARDGEALDLGVLQLPAEELVRDELADRGAELEAVAATAGREVQPLDARDRPEQRVPVRRHVGEADAPPGGAHAGKARQPPRHALVHVALERVVDAVVIGVRIDLLVFLRKAAAGEETTVAGRP